MRNNNGSNNCNNGTGMKSSNVFAYFKESGAADVINGFDVKPSRDVRRAAPDRTFLQVSINNANKNCIGIGGSYVNRACLSAIVRSGGFAGRS